MFSVKVGNLFDEDFQAVAHGCNCGGYMSAGIAAEFAHRYPQMKEEYKALCVRGEFNLGDIFVWETYRIGFGTGPYVADRHVVYNLATQWFPGPDARDWAVAASLYKAVQDAEKRGLTTFGIPLIGAGIGGLDPARAISIFKDIGESTNISLVLVTLKETAS